MRISRLFHICARQGDEMSVPIALEAQRIVREAAGDARGLTIKAQLREACRSLGYPSGSWRIAAAWYGHAGCWSAAAIRDLQGRYLRWRERDAARTDHEHMMRAQRDRELLETARNECAETLANLDQQLAAFSYLFGGEGPRPDR